MTIFPPLRAELDCVNLRLHPGFRFETTVRRRRRRKRRRRRRWGGRGREGSCSIVAPPGSAPSQYISPHWLLRSCLEQDAQRRTDPHPLAPALSLSLSLSLSLFHSLALSLTHTRTHAGTQTLGTGQDALQVTTNISVVLAFNRVLKKKKVFFLGNQIFIFHNIDKGLL